MEMDDDGAPIAKGIKNEKKENRRENRNHETLLNKKRLDGNR